MMTQIIAFLQRLVSPIGESEVKAAWAEFVVLVGCIVVLVNDFKAKTFSLSDIMNQGSTFYGTLMLLVANIRAIIMSNQTAVANDALPKVTGTLGTPGVAPTATNSIPKP